MLKIKLLRSEAKSPSIAHPCEDLGYDLYAAESVSFAPRGGGIVPTGISIELTDAQGKPMGALIRDRSSMAVRRLIVTAGVIDSGYRGEIKIVMENLSGESQTVNTGDKIANLIPYPVLTGEIEVVEELTDSSRKTGGFGSSGKI